MKVSVNIKVPAELRDQAKALFDNIGLDMTTAVTLFLKTSVKENAIPFVLAGEPSAQIIEQLENKIASNIAKGEKDYENGKYRSFESLRTELRESHGI